MHEGELLTRGLAQLAVGCHLFKVLSDLRGSHDRWARWVWTLGCAGLWLHIVAAFHFVHDWSHAEALRQTAEETRKLTGWYWAGGIYINYAFAGLWLFDVLGWWSAGHKPRPQSPARFWTIHAVFAFMMLNATVVFGPDYWRIVAVSFTAVAVLIWLVRRRRA